MPGKRKAGSPAKPATDAAPGFKRGKSSANLLAPADLQVSDGETGLNACHWAQLAKDIAAVKSVDPNLESLLALGLAGDMVGRQARSRGKSFRDRNHSHTDTTQAQTLIQTQTHIHARAYTHLTHTYTRSRLRPCACTDAHART
eukprot:5601759-Alexandrium_andersonii.AAC.1